MHANSCMKVIDAATASERESQDEPRRRKQSTAMAEEPRCATRTVDRCTVQRSRTHNVHNGTGIGVTWQSLME